MVTNYCKEHGKVWFQKGKMKGFAHPIEHEDGSTTWCNRPEDWAEPAETTTNKDAPPKMVDIEPQERGMWMKEVGELIRANILTKDTLFGEKNEVARPLWNAYWAGMLIGLSIKAERKDEHH